MTIATPAIRVKISSNHTLRFSFATIERLVPFSMAAISASFLRGKTAVCCFHMSFRSSNSIAPTSVCVIFRGSCSYEHEHYFERYLWFQQSLRTELLPG